MNQPNTTAWSKAVCTATCNFFTCRTPCRCGWKTPCFSCNTDHLNIAFFNMFPDTGLARLPLCQSGRWKDINFSFRVGATFQVWPGQTVNLGRFKLCINSYRIDGRELAITELIPTDGPDEKGYMNWRATNATQYSPYYMGIHCFI